MTSSTQMIQGEERKKKKDEIIGMVFVHSDKMKNREQDPGR